MCIKSVAGRDKPKSANEGGRRTSVGQRRVSQHMDPLELRDLVSDWLIQSGRKGMRNQQEPLVFLLLGDSETKNQLRCS